MHLPTINCVTGTHYYFILFFQPFIKFFSTSSNITFLFFLYPLLLVAAAVKSFAISETNLSFYNNNTKAGEIYGREKRNEHKAALFCLHSGAKQADKCSLRQIFDCIYFCIYSLSGHFVCKSNLLRQKNKMDKRTVQNAIFFRFKSN